MPDGKNNLSVEGDVFATGLPFVVPKRIQYTDFNSAARDIDFNAGDLGLDHDVILYDVVIKVVTAFVGTGITGASVDVSDVTTDDTWIQSADVTSTGWTGTSLADKGTDLDDNSTYITESGADLHVRLSTQSADGDQLTAGDATIFAIFIDPGEPLD